MTYAKSMNLLTPSGSARLDQIARQNEVSDEAARAVLDALVRGGGTQAQFSHPDLGGMGQWSRGGMIMIGDMFNNDLKARVDRLCADLTGLLRDPAAFEASPDVIANNTTTRTMWWPDALGQPSSSGSQNDSRYAYFPEEQRLAIEEDGAIRVYDTGDHRISGVSQSQGDGRDLAFHSQKGTVRVHELAPVEVAPREAILRATSASGEPAHTPFVEATGGSGAEDVVGKIERLHDLMRKGALTEAEFSEKKNELLARI